MQSKTYYNGDGINSWGIYNTVTKEFQFGIKEKSPYLARKKLFGKIGKNAYKWRFKTKMLPK